MRNRVSVLLLVVLPAVLVSTSAFAAAPKLTVEGDDGAIALELSAVSIRVTVRGHLARTEYELTYRNSLNRVTGGEFSFPLPADAEVSDLGLWFDGHLRHGVAVERVLARTAYEEVVHANVDPALAEWSADRSFHLNIYPIPAKGEKQVLIAYDQGLTDSGYVLDVGYLSSVESHNVKIDSDRPAIEKDGVIRIEPSREETAFTARAEDGLWYASAALDFAPPGREVGPASQVVILYDTSSSSVQQDRALIQRFLSGFLARQTAWATAEVIPFHVQLDEAHRISEAGTPAGALAIERFLGELQPLGATNLMALAAHLTRITASLGPSARIVLVTDGLTSLGDSRAVAAAVAKLSAVNRPLLIVHATTAVNDDLLANAARATGGWMIDLKRVGAEKAVEMAMQEPITVALSGSDVAPGVILMSGKGRHVIAERSKEPFTTFPLSLNTHGREASRSVPIRALHGEVEGSMVRRSWARARLRELMARAAPDEELILHGRTFTQLTPRTSLLVLENWRDYARYDIPMPPDVAAEQQRELAERNPSRETNPQPAPPPPASVIHGGWSLSGRVLDSSGNPLPGVTVQLQDGDAVIATDVTNVDGRYLVSSVVAPKQARVVAHMEGFAPKDWPLGSGTSSGLSLDVVLSMAAVTQSITVTAAAPLVDVTASSVASSVAAPSLRGGNVDTDELLSRISTQDSSLTSDDPAVRQAVARQRRELTRAVIDRLRSLGSTSERLRYYVSARSLLGGDKGFHFFAAEVFRERSPEVAARVLSDLAEARPGDAPLLRILARVLDGWGEESLARLLLERAIEISPTEPQTWREIILLEARHGKPGSVESWSKRMLAGKRRDEMNEVYAQTDEALARWRQSSFLDRQRGVDVRSNDGDDLTIELMFDTGWSWVDLHVTEPSGETVTWNHTESAAGATFTGGMTFGFGPEIYTLRNAPPGEYRLAVDYYSDDPTNVSLETLVHVIVRARNRRGGVERRDYFMVLGEEKQNLPLTTVQMW